MTEDDLSPCPFCGSSSVKTLSNIGKPCSADHAWVRCLKCHAEGPEAPTEESARGAWKTRLNILPLLQPMLDKARAEGKEEGIKEAMGVVDKIYADHSFQSSTEALIRSKCAEHIAAAIRDLLYVEIPRISKEG